MAVGVVLLVFAAYQLGAFAPGRPPVDLNAAKYIATGEVIGTRYPDEGNGHVPAGQRVSYNTNPPTSGSHWAQPAGLVPWGIKDTTLPDEATTHNLEHGGIVIGYKGLTAEETKQLADIVRVLMNNGYPKIVLQPYPALTDARIALSAWRWQLKLQAFDDVAVVKFVKQHFRGPDAPEPNGA